MRIGILGGTFDPLHRGHLALARESEGQFQLDKILFIPANLPPHKKPEAVLTPAAFRARMVELAIVGEPKWGLSDLELRRLGVSYTVDTLQALKKIYPDPSKLFFIVGADSYVELKTWKDPEEILRLSEWIVAPRASVRLPKAPPPRVHWLKMAPIEISASELREKIGRGEDCSKWIPGSVLDYLQRMKLYSSEKK